MAQLMLREKMVGGPIRIRMNPKGLGATIVSIQVGSGDEQASRAINSALANNLGVKTFLEIILCYLESGRAGHPEGKSRAD